MATSASSTLALPPLPPTRDPLSLGDQILQALGGNKTNSLASQVNKGSLKYLQTAANHPTLEDAMCQAAGKVCIIIAHFKEALTGPVQLCGQIGQHTDATKTPIAWHKPVDAATQIAPGPKTKVFIFPIPPEMNNEKLDCKIVAKATAAGQNDRWENRDNHTISLNEYGHHAIIQLNDVSF